MSPPWRFSLFRSRVPHREAPRPLMQCQMRRQGIVITLRMQGMRTLCFLMRSSLSGLFPPSCATSTSGGWVPCPSRRLWLFCFREPPLYVQVLLSIFFFIVSVMLADFLFFFFCIVLFFRQVATYAKGLARRASLTEGFAKAVKSYKAKAASLTSESWSSSSDKGTD